MRPLTAEQRALCEQYQYLPLWVLHNKPFGATMHPDDRLSAANLALVHAARCYKPEVGAFTTYATRCIALALCRAQRQDRLISVPAYVYRPATPRTRRQQAEMAGVVVSIADAGWREPASPEPDEEPARADEIDQLLAAIATLPPRHKTVIEGRMAGRTLKSLGDELGCTRERIRQLEDKAVESLRGALCPGGVA